jgi:hypothetical protein
MLGVLYNKPGPGPFRKRDSLQIQKSTVFYTPFKAKGCFRKSFKDWVPITIPIPGFFQTTLSLIEDYGRLTE